MKEPHITEKASDLTNYNQYVFKVYKNANKTEIKKAVEQVYKVNVVDVKIINVKEKKRRLGRFEGVKPGFKKAIVKLKEGQKIEIFPR
jgi:large subunit ribosomal protein L23